MIKSIPLKVLLLDDGGSRMDPVTSDGLLILGFLAVVLAPMALALAETGGGAGWKLLTFLCCAFAAWFFRVRFKCAHCACSVGPSVGMRDGNANKLQSTPCVIHDDASWIAANIAKLPENASSTGNLS